MPEFARLPLVAVTGYGQPSDPGKVRAAGFEEHLIKPLEAGRVGAAIEELLPSRDAGHAARRPSTRGPKA